MNKRRVFFWVGMLLELSSALFIFGVLWYQSIVGFDFHDSGAAILAVIVTAVFLFFSGAVFSSAYE